MVESLDCVGRTASLFSMHSVTLPRSCRHSSKKQKQHLNHCMFYVSCCCHFISLSATLLTNQTQGSPLMGSEIYTLTRCATRKHSLHFVWKLCPVNFHCYFCLFLSWSFQCRWSICSMHFNCLSSLVLVILLTDAFGHEFQTSTPLSY